LLIGSVMAIEPHANLWAQPWLSFGHILRSAVWMQLAMGAVGLLPTPGTSSRQLFRVNSVKAEGQKTNIPPFSLGTALAMAMLLAGVVLMNVWLLMLGAFLLLGSHISASQSLGAPEGDMILVREVMLTEYTLLSTSDTLQDAATRTVHSLQDVFPVVRGDRLVGSVSRQTIVDRLQMEGDGYLQGVMTRSLRLAEPGEKLVDALRRAASMGASEFIPVVEGAAMLGILTPQSLSRAVQQVKLARPAVQADGGRGQD
jgi:CBS domain-containing protein